MWQCLSNCKNDYIKPPYKWFHMRLLKSKKSFDFYSEKLFIQIKKCTMFDVLDTKYHCVEAERDIQV